MDNVTNLLNPGGPDNPPPAGGNPQPTGNPPELHETIALLTESSTPEEINAFYTKLGRPASADKYDLHLAPGADDSLAKAIAPVLFEAGLSSKQASAIAQGYNGIMAQMQSARQEAYEKAQQAEMDALRKDWGNDFDARVEIARQAARKYHLDGNAIDALERALGSKNLMTFLHGIGSTVMDAPVKTGSTNLPPNAAAYTPQEASAKLKELMADDNWTAKYLGGDKDAVKLFDDLTRAGGEL